MSFAFRGSILLSTFLLVSACGGSDSGVAMDGGASDAPIVIPDAAFTDTGAFVPGDVITATDRTWTWIDFPNTQCMNGSATGLGVYLNPDSDKVIIYLDGGGACFNDATCASVANPNGYNASSFAAPGSGVFNESDEDNPFRGWNKVFVPYCTGDIYAGANPSGFNGNAYMGYVNMGEYMNRLVPTFGSSSLVVLSGSSAGGFGASYNYDRTQQAFGDTPVYLLNDSAPLFSADYLKPCLQEILRTTWNLDATLPDDCTECFASGGMSNFLPFLTTKYPDRRFGLVSSTRDSTIRYFYGFGFSEMCDVSASFTGTEYTEALEQLRDVTLAGHDNFNTYYISSAQHVWFFDSLGTVDSGASNTTLAAWLSSWVDSNMTVTNVAP